MPSGDPHTSSAASAPFKPAKLLGCIRCRLALAHGPGSLLSFNQKVSSLPPPHSTPYTLSLQKTPAGRVGVQEEKLVRGPSEAEEGWCGGFRPGFGGSGAQHSKRRRKKNLRKKSPFAAKKKKSP